MTPPLPYKDDVTITFSVRDLPAALAWYRERLGFESLYHLEDMGWAEMKTHLPGVTVGLGQVETMEGRGGSTPVWGVTDIAAARATLEAAQVKFDGPTREIPGMVKLATFYDPDGNTMMLVESLQQGG